MLSYQKQYQEKLRSPEEAVKIVKSGDNVDYGFFNGKPAVCDQALADRAEELEDVFIFGAVSLPPVPMVTTKPETFTYNDLQFSKLTRILALENKNLFYMPVLYHLVPRLIRNKESEQRNVGMYQVCPMDDKGWFNLGPQNSETLAKMEVNQKVIVEVNQNMPVCLGGAEEAVHISSVDFIVEAPEDQAPFEAPAAVPSETDKKIASRVMDQITDGCVIQLGIGGMPDAVGKMIAQSDLKNLGGHTEMFVDAYVDMIEAGRMNGAKKTFDRNRVAYTFAIGSRRMYDFMDKNPAIVSYPVTYTNDPKIISRHDNFVSINNALQVDLYSQINAESNGYTQISGNGGMWDFVLGSQWSKNGKSFICLASTFTDKEGNVKSRIVPTFAPGSITTIPRQMVDYIVTEYGMARMHMLPTWQRAEAIIGLAHPDFREDLIKAAQAQGIWRQSNKR